MFSATATMEPRYLVNVGSTLLRFMAACITEITRPMSQRPTIQKAIAARTLTANSETVVLRKFWMLDMSIWRDAPGFKVRKAAVRNCIPPPCVRALLHTPGGCFHHKVWKRPEFLAPSIRRNNDDK
jgi:hypothetical protein